MCRRRKNRGQTAFFATTIISASRTHLREKGVSPRCFSPAGRLVSMRGKSQPKNLLPTVTFSSVGAMLGRSLVVFFGNFGFIAGVTLAAYAPLKFVVFSICQVAGVSPGGVASSIIRDVADGISSSLVAPALIYGIVSVLRDQRTPPIRECLRRGFGLWWPTLWNDVKAEITIGLRMLLLVVPGVIAAVRLAFVEQIVALEPDNRAVVLARSREIAAGHGWKIFFTCIPAAVVGFLSEWLLFSLMDKLGLSWTVAAFVDCGLALAGQWSTVLLTLMYLALQSGGSATAARSE